jgi:hypothetical protein
MQADADGVRTSAGRGALLRLAKNVEIGADDAGLITPSDLYTLRKEAGDTIEKLVSAKQQPSSGSKKRAAGLVMGFKQLVDDALGPDFKDYLATHREGMAAMNRRELVAEAANLADTSPNQFVRMMKGGRDETVENILGRGTNQYAIDALATTDPDSYAVLQSAAREFEAASRMDELSRSGARSAAEILSRERPLTSRFLTRIGLSTVPSARIAAEGGELAMASYLGPRVRNYLADAYSSGVAMDSILGAQPAAFRLSESLSRLDPGVRNALAQGMLRPMTAGDNTSQSAGNGRPRAGY